MRFHASPRTTLAAAALVTGAVTLSACSAGSLGSSDDESGKTTISFLTNNDPNNVKVAEAVAKAFEAENDDIDVKVDTRPGGGDGDNLVKTKLSTGDMAEVFAYNSGSLFQALAPTSEPHARSPTSPGWPTWTRRSRPSSRPSEQVYGAPWGTHHRRRRPLQHPGLRGARPRGPQDLGRVHRQQRDDQGRGRHRAGRCRPTATPGPASSSCWPTTTTSPCADPTFADDYTANKAKYADDARGPARASSTCRRSTSWVC